MQAAEHLRMRLNCLPHQPAVPHVRAQAFDLLTLVALMREGWHSIKGKSAVSPAELDQAESYADALLTAVGEREQLPAATAAAADMRRRAFTLFLRAYAELRHAAEYLRRYDNDADAFVPSLYGPRKRRVASEATTSDAVAEPAVPPPSTRPTENHLPLSTAEVRLHLGADRHRGLNASSTNGAQRAGLGVAVSVSLRAREKLIVVLKLPVNGAPAFTGGAGRVGSAVCIGAASMSAGVKLGTVSADPC